MPRIDKSKPRGRQRAPDKKQVVWDPSLWQAEPQQYISTKPTLMPVQESLIADALIAIEKPPKVDSLLKVWDNCIFVGEIQRDYKTKYKFYAATSYGYRCILIKRSYYKTRKHKWVDDTYCSLAIPIKASLDNGESFIDPAKSFIDIMQKAYYEAETMELWNDENVLKNMVKEINQYEQ